MYAGAGLRARCLFFSRVVRDEVAHAVLRRGRFSRFRHSHEGVPGQFDEPAVEGQQGLASRGGAEMQRIGEIHAFLHAIKGFGGQVGTLHRDARQAAATSSSAKP